MKRLILGFFFGVIWGLGVWGATPEDTYQKAFAQFEQKKYIESLNLLTEIIQGKASKAWKQKSLLLQGLCLQGMGYEDEAQLSFFEFQSFFPDLKSETQYLSVRYAYEQTQSQTTLETLTQYADTDIPPYLKGVIADQLHHIYKRHQNEDQVKAMARLLINFPYLIDPKPITRPSRLQPETNQPTAFGLYESALRAELSGQITDAIRYCETLIEQYPDHSFVEQATFKLGQLYRESDQLKTAKVSLINFMRTYPSSALLDAVYFELGLIYGYEKNYAFAQDFFLKLLTEHQTSQLTRRARLMIAKNLVHQDELEEAKNRLEQLVRDQSDDSVGSWATWYLGWINWNQKDYQAAHHQFSNTHFSVNQTQARFHHWAAKSARRSDQKELADTHTRAAVLAHPTTFYEPQYQTPDRWAPINIPDLDPRQIMIIELGWPDLVIYELKHKIYTANSLSDRTHSTLQLVKLYDSENKPLTQQDQLISSHLSEVPDFQLPAFVLRRRYPQLGEYKTQKRKADQIRYVLQHLDAPRSDQSLERWIKTYPTYDYLAVFGYLYGKDHIDRQTKGQVSLHEEDIIEMLASEFPKRDQLIQSVLHRRLIFQWLKAAT